MKKKIKQSAIINQITKYIFKVIYLKAYLLTNKSWSILSQTQISRDIKY